MASQAHAEKRGRGTAGTANERNSFKQRTACAADTVRSANHHTADAKAVSSWHGKLVGERGEASWCYLGDSGAFPRQNEGGWECRRAAKTGCAWLHLSRAVPVRSASDVQSLGRCVEDVFAPRQTRPSGCSLRGGTKRAVCRRWARRRTACGARSVSPDIRFRMSAFLPSLSRARAAPQEEQRCAHTADPSQHSERRVRKWPAREQCLRWTCPRSGAEGAMCAEERENKSCVWRSGERLPPWQQSGARLFCPRH